jgi:hypothetical protein
VSWSSSPAVSALLVLSGISCRHHDGEALSNGLDHDEQDPTTGVSLADQLVAISFAAL